MDSDGHWQDVSLLGLSADEVYSTAVAMLHSKAVEVSSTRSRHVASVVGWWSAGASVGLLWSAGGRFAERALQTSQRVTDTKLRMEVAAGTLELELDSSHACAGPCIACVWMLLVLQMSGQSILSRSQYTWGFDSVYKPRAKTHQFMRLQPVPTAVRVQSTSCRSIRSGQQPTQSSPLPCPSPLLCTIDRLPHTGR